MSFVRIIGIAAVFCVTSACAESADETDEDVSSDEADIVGGNASALKSVVVVVDANDRYLCTGVAITSRIVHAGSGCGSSAAAIYVGFSAAVDHSATLGPFAGSATKIAVASRESTPGFAGQRLHLATSTPSVATVEMQLPASGSTCTVTGYGPTAGINGAVPNGPYTVGRQRSAKMLVTSTSPGEVHAVTTNGTVLFGDLDAFLFCGGRLIGPKRWSTFPSGGVPVETVFSPLGVAPPAQCASGAIDTTTAGCISGKRTRACSANGRWGPFSATCS